MGNAVLLQHCHISVFFMQVYCCSGLLQTEDLHTQSCSLTCSPPSRFCWIPLLPSQPRTAPGPFYTSYCLDSHSTNTPEINSPVTTTVSWKLIDNCEVKCFLAHCNWIRSPVLGGSLLKGSIPLLQVWGPIPETRTLHQHSCNRASTLEKDF